MSDSRAKADDPAPPRHALSSVEPHSQAAEPSTHVDRLSPDGMGASGTPGEGDKDEMQALEEGTVLLVPQQQPDPDEDRTKHVASPEMVDQQLEHAGPVVNEFLVEHQPPTLQHDDDDNLPQEGVMARETAAAGGEGGLAIPRADTDNQTLLGPPSPNLYGEPTPPARTVELPVSPLLSPDFDPPAPPIPTAALAPTSSAAAPKQTSPHSLQIKTHPADLASTSSTRAGTPSESVPSTPISPSGGDAGHDGAEEDNGANEEDDDDDDRPLWGRPVRSAVPGSLLLGQAQTQDTSAGRDSLEDSDPAQRSEESDAVEALDPAAIARTRGSAPVAPAARPVSASQPPPFIAPPRFADASPSELPPTVPQAASSRAQQHGRSYSVATPPSSSTSPASVQGGTAFQSALSSAMGPPPARHPSDRYRASSAATASSGLPNGAAAPRSPSSGAAPSSSLAREASLRSSPSSASNHYRSHAATSAGGNDSHPPSRQASISTNGGRSTGGTATDGHASRSGSRRTATAAGTGAESGGSSSQVVVQGARSRRTLGEWQLTKTLGAGSMGKVKLGVSQVTGEKVAIKIIPRFTSTASAQRQSEQSQQAQQAAAVAPNDPTAAAAAKKADPTASFIAKAAAKDASKEVRTVREGSLCLLLHHPYICGMREMLVYPHHYYFVQEYVNGGQMLDYIIAHGRLRERSARKFARQIGSALEYCHANSIVHRDLKIENILISKTGNIKIIDFGLSNLYSPASHLSTFCGSLYFAAPELLNAKPYTGPEVDVWSFGIVLYVLVCGKVPFDDQSMPALHAKIKRGQVEYPAWLSSECKHLLSRMLVTVPTQRATLHEVLNHPWIVKGFPSPPAAHIPTRLPLRPGELDEDVIRGMTGFEFGTEEEIATKLGEVIQSDGYRQAVRNWEAKRNSFGLGDGGSASDSDRERPAMRTDGKDMRRSPSSKRFSGLGFYGKKLAGGFNAAFAGASAPPPKAYNELEPGAAGSTETSFIVNGLAPRPDQLDPTRGFHPLLSIYYLVKEKIDRERIWGPGVFASSTLSLTGPPPPPAPAQAYATGSTLVSPPVSVDVRPALPTPPVPITPQPRQRATGDFATMPASAPARPNEYSSANKRASYFGPAASPASPAIPSFRQPNDYEAPGSPTPRERKQSNRMSLMMGSPAVDRERDRFGEPQSAVAAAGDDVPLATISQSPSSPSGFARRFSSLLGKSSPDSNGVKGHRTRASIATSSHKSSTKTAASALPQVAEAEPVGALRPPPQTRLPSSGSDVPLASPPDGKPVVRSSTVGDISPSRHQRGASMAAPSIGAGAATAASPLSQSVGMNASADSSRTASRERRRHGEMFDDLEEEELIDEGADTPTAGTTVPTATDAEGRQSSIRSGKQDKAESAKPVWLKGLFSVSTTSTKPIATLRTDLVRVLDRLGVQHRDVKNGYECAHVPSIDLSSLGGTNDAAAAAKDKRGGTVRRRASKLLLPSSRDNDRPVDAGESSNSLPPASPVEARNGNGYPAPPTGARFEADGGAAPAPKNDMIVRFEIFLVKMPLLPGIHGLQFRRIGGDAWQYQMLARRVLQELKL
ncbi:hypothetical protein JCM10908_001492 [Rhodotorula pacifica]|uniref:uncharacterized protein n=1 Tax=Rhodotorula pacifica TaxID=1495444 RepID=UPI0031761E75